MKIYKNQSFKCIKNFIKNGYNKRIKLGTICISLSLITLMSGCIKKNSNEETTTEIVTINTPDVTVKFEETKEIVETTIESYEQTPITTNETIQTTEFTTQNIESIVKEVIANDISSNKIFVNHEEFKISDELLNKIQSQIKKYPNKSAFYVVTLDGSLSFGYNIDQQFHAASSVKAPYVLYCLKEIENGNGSLDEIMTYEKKHYEGKSGVIQYSKFGTEYTLKDIIYYTIHESDNAGFYMLHDRFPKAGYNEMLEELGLSKMKLTGSMKFGMITPREMLTIWNEIYNYSNKSELGAYYLELLKGAKYNFIKDELKQTLGTDCEIAHKSGFNAKGRHDVAIVFSDEPYFITVMTDNPGENSNSAHIMAMAKLLNEVINEYQIYLTNVNEVNMQK